MSTISTGAGAEARGHARLRLGTCPDRIGYVHIKQVDPAIVAQADRDGLAFGQAVAMGASCEPPSGEPAVEEVAKALRGLGIGLDDDPGRQP